LRPPSEEEQYTVQGQEFPVSGRALAELLRDVVSKGMLFRFRAKGWSMSPFIKDGDVITIEPVRPGEPRAGDAVAFIHSVNGRLVVHRVVRKIDGDCLIQGDSASEPDGVVSSSDILGRVARVERNGRSVRLGMGPERRLIAILTRNGLFLRFIIPAWMVVRPLFRKGEGL
jgi:phage repressor protein C with HTH and peptisase S24 domain